MYPLPPHTFCIDYYFICSLADYIAAANHRLDELKEKTHPVSKDNSIASHTSSSCNTSGGSSQLPTAQVSQFSLNHIHKPMEELLPEKAVPVDTSEVDALLEKFKSEIEVCHRRVCMYLNV